jgi:DNA-binding transcriptional regulator YiaG
MTAAEFKHAQTTLGLTNQAMADLLCCSLRLVEKMRQGERRVSARTEKLLRRELDTNYKNTKK